MRGPGDLAPHLVKLGRPHERDQSLLEIPPLLVACSLPDQRIVLLFAARGRGRAAGAVLGLLGALRTNLGTSGGPRSLHPVYVACSRTRAARALGATGALTARRARGGVRRTNLEAGRAFGILLLRK